MSSKVFLCFDHGEKRLGVAVGQSITATATPLQTLLCKNGKPDWNEVAGLIKHWQPSDFVVGMPLTMEGNRQQATEAAERFARQLHGRYLLPVHLADERLSSLEARQRLQSSYNIDAHAAQLILESWLAQQASTESDATMPGH